ncbi:MAG: ankyrin repeat domain-containing protein, partial [Alphaproteobacteria bacterium]|nr:ankyrin repeat domain-containing protein [Alphaproteobacteria bacterium]
SAGTDVNAKGPGGETPLHDAAIAGRKEVVELLIAAGADVNRLFFEPFKLQGELNDGQTPLDWAIFGAQSEVVDLIRKLGGKTAKELHHQALIDESIEAVTARFAGQGFAEFKSELAELAAARLEPIAAEMRHLMASPDYIDDILKNGGERASAIAEPNLAGIKKIIGLLDP